MRTRTDTPSAACSRIDLQWISKVQGIRYTI
uniref:Uncharacterized protein n=1 Tax=Arundo donax TaxID=35708 RepID=A0A0A9ASY2_ARUDO